MLLGRTIPAVLGIALTQCYPPGDGIEPPASRIYFPVGLGIDYGSSSLFVANSDFDLQYNQGVLQSYDLARLRETVPRACRDDADCAEAKRCDVTQTEQNSNTPSYFCVDREGELAGLPCGAFPEATASERVIAPGRCGVVNPSRPQDGGSSLIKASVQIGAFATDALFKARPEDAPDGPAGRLFVPVRGDTTLHFVDVDEDGSLDCGQDRAEGRCDDAHRVGDDPDAENTRDLRMPVDPFGIAASADGRALTVTHQTQGQVSLFVNDWSPLGLRLEFVLGGLPSRPMEMDTLPVPELVTRTNANYQPGFLVTFRNTNEVHLIRFFDDGLFGDAGSVPARPYLADVGTSRITTNSLGSDSRGIAVDGSQRSRAEAACGPGSEAEQLECLRQASGVPLDVYVANRTPPSLVLGRTQPGSGVTSSSDVPSFYRSLPLQAGPSRVLLGSIINAAGEPEMRVFVVCFDSRLIFIYDPNSERIEAEIFTGRGPHAMTFDEAEGLGYVGHFTDSYIGVVQLDQRLPHYAMIVSTIGTPTPPRATK